MVIAGQSLSRVLLFEILWTIASQVPLSSTLCWSLLKHMSIESVLLPSHLILCQPLLLPSIFPSIRVFSNENSMKRRKVSSGQRGKMNDWGSSPNIAGIKYQIIIYLVISSSPFKPPEATQYITEISNLTPKFLQSLIRIQITISKHSFLKKKR